MDGACSELGGLAVAVTRLGINLSSVFKAFMQVVFFLK